jgi:hypothetical protein
MRGSNRIELMALPLVAVLLGALFLVFAAATGGIWAWLLAGALILVGIALGARSFSRSRLGAPEEHGARPARDPGRYEVLVVADDRCPPEEVSRIVAEHAAGRPVRALVVAPALGSRLDRITGDESAYERAKDLLDATLRALGSVSENRAGKLGSHDPIQAIDEALREFPADEILIAAHRAGSQNPLERDLVEVAASRYERRSRWQRLLRLPIPTRQQPRRRGKRSSASRPTS